MYLICGLGNPGEKYKENRHNIGFRIIEELISFYKMKEFKSDKLKATYKGLINNNEVILFKALTFMNLTGTALSTFKKFYKIDINNIIIIHDELDLKFGKIKYKKGGGNSGHNGLENIDQNIGSDYARVRFGIGHPGNKNLVENYVLEDFNNNEKLVLDKLIKNICKNFYLLIENDPQKFISDLSEKQFTSLK
tara:strand:+ start:76 stop:654 length:579 start_codon:yes stop_codon:yes gene_type:complete